MKKQSLPRILKRCPQGLFLFIALMLCKMSTAATLPWEPPSSKAPQLPAIKGLFFEAALTHTEKILEEIHLNQRPHGQHLIDTLSFYEELQEFTFSLLPEGLKKTGNRLIEQTGGLNPQMLKCGHVVSIEHHEHFVIRGVQAIVAVALLYLGYNDIALISMIVPTEWLSTLPLHDIQACQALWEAEGLAKSDAHAISLSIGTLSETSFLSAAILKLKYDELAHLDWDASSTWNDLEWGYVKIIFQNIQALLLNLHEHLLGNLEEGIYSERLRAITLS